MPLRHRSRPGSAKKDLRYRTDDHPAVCARCLLLLLVAGCSGWSGIIKTLPHRAIQSLPSTSAAEPVKFIITDQRGTQTDRLPRARAQQGRTGRGPGCTCGFPEKRERKCTLIFIPANLQSAKNSLQNGTHCIKRDRLHTLVQQCAGCERWKNFPCG